MATTAQSPAGAPQWTRSPSAHEALEAHYAANPDTRPQYPHKWDTSRSDIYFENRWEPIFKEMRAAGPLHYIPESPYGPYWSVVGHKAIQHTEALPDIFSSSWEYGGITILDDLPTFPRKSGCGCRCSSRWTGPSIPASARR